MKYLSILIIVLLSGCAGQNNTVRITLPIYSSETYGTLGAEIGITYTPPDKTTFDLPGGGKVYVPTEK